MNAHPELSKLSKQNVEYWSAIRTGDMDQIVSFNNSDMHDTRDIHGNNALMIACIHHQPKIVEYILSKPASAAAVNVTNDMKSTPLMLAIHRGKSLETVKVLLKDPAVIQSISTSVDKLGYTAILYACSINNLEILATLLDIVGHKDLDGQINELTGESALHIAARNRCSTNFMKYIMNHLRHDSLRLKNQKQQTFYHLCRNKCFLENLLLNDDVGQNVVYNIMHDLDEASRSPLMTWATKGRLDLIELVVAKYANNGVGYSKVDKNGRTLLHLLAMHLCKGLTYGEKSIDYLVENLKSCINVKDWVHGNTPLHIAAETSTLASAQSIHHAISFVNALVRHGAVIDSVNDRDEHPINICRIPELTSCLDGRCRYTILIKSD